MPLVDTISLYQGKCTNHFNSQRSLESPNNTKSSCECNSFNQTIDPDGFRELYMDNQYSVPELFVMLKTKYKILACGTICTNRKGRDPKVMNLLKSVTRGNQKLYTIQSMGFCLDNGRTTR